MKERKIGLIIVFPPYILKEGEGLSTLLLSLLKGFQEKGIRIILAYPSWLDNDLKSLLKAQYTMIDHSRIEFISPKRVPIVVILEYYLSKIHSILHRRKKPLLKKWFQAALLEFEQKIPRALGRLNYSSIIFLILLFISAVVLFLILSLIIISGHILVSLRKILSQKIKEKNTASIYFNTILNEISSMQIRTVHELMKHESKKLASLIHPFGDDIRWVIFTPFWPEMTRAIPKPVVIFPDIVFHETPVGYGMDQLLDFHLIRKNNIRESLKESSQIITYSEYTKMCHVQGFLEIRDKKISVVHHAPLDLSGYLNILRPFSELSLSEKRDLCLQIVTDYLKTLDNEYLSDFDISDVQFLLYSSQLRPHKNFFHLFQALNLLIRERYHPIKLVVTAGVHGNRDLQKYISDNGLSRDIIIVPRISQRVLAAFYHLAALAINPTLFEGDLPFTFSEAMSVGTPVLLSRIPVVEEVIHDPQIQDIILFDPRDVDNMAEKISWGLNNRDLLYRIEKPLYDQMKKRTWADVAEKYYQVAYEE
ncbi:MAG TPA: glycosyltransferase [Methanolinea sp.]|jgi:hypothetical protein|nr:glycosyltransferase [Methanolinea sp.]